MDLRELNRVQRKAAETTKGPLSLIAGAGSCKTRTMTYRKANYVRAGI